MIEIKRQSSVEEQSLPKLINDNQNIQGKIPSNNNNISSGGIPFG